MKKRNLIIILGTIFIMTARGRKETLYMDGLEVEAEKLQEIPTVRMEAKSVDESTMMFSEAEETAGVVTEKSKEVPEPTKTLPAKSVSVPSTASKLEETAESTITLEELPTLTPVPEPEQDSTACGNTKEESISMTPHNYVSDTTEATCTEAGRSRTYCSICGDVQSEMISGEATGHDYQKEYWPAPPTCLNGADYIIKCTKCGISTEEGYQREGAVPHTPVSTEIFHGNCVTPTIIVTTCSECGFEINRDGYFEDEHDWVTGTYEEFNLDTLEWETKTSTYCSRCNELQ